MFIHIFNGIACAESDEEDAKYLKELGTMYYC